jgi:ArsR family transcriptional regulator, lead/cadmium/zinc/bismuth-responsive transcriptional repressor
VTVETDLAERALSPKLSEATACGPCGVHADRVEAAKASAVDRLLLGDLGELFKLFSDPTRLRILGALGGGELCVCDIGAVLGASQSAVSHQLALLRAARLVSYRREGKTVFYRLADDHVGSLLKVGLEHASERGGRASDGS